MEYKDRWSVETYYNYVGNGLNLNGLHEQNYYTQEGIGFLMLVEGQIFSNVLQKIEDSKLPYIHNMSVNECLRTAGRLKVAEHPDHTWHMNAMKGKIVELFKWFNVSKEEDVKALNKSALQ